MDFLKKNYFNAAVILLILYTASVLARHWLSAFSSVPTIFYDELVYMSLAKSIYFEGNTDFRGQVFIYKNLLYPLILSLSYVFKDPQTIYTAMKFIGCLIMSSAVFPAYYLAVNLLNNSKKALIIAVIAILIPEMFYTVHIMAEVIYYPLFLWCIFLINQDFKQPYNIYRLVILGTALFLVYFAKSVAVCLLLGYLIVQILDLLYFKSNSRKYLIYRIIIVTAIFGGLYQLNNVIIFYMNGAGNLADFYSQMIPTGLNIHTLASIVNGIGTYLVYISLALFVFPLLLPLLSLTGKEEQPNGDHKFVLLTYIQLCLYLAAIVALIYIREDAANDIARIHYRYIFPFIIPLLIMFMKTDFTKIKNNALFASIISGLMVMLLFSDLQLTSAVLVDAPSLVYLFIGLLGIKDFAIYIKALFVMCAVALAFGFATKTNKYKKYVLILVIIVSLMNNGFQYYRIGADKSDIELRREITAVVKFLKQSSDDNVLILSEDIPYDSQLCALESALLNPYNLLVFKDYWPQMQKNGELYLCDIKSSGYIGASYPIRDIKEDIRYIITKRSLPLSLKDAEEITVDEVSSFRIIELTGNKIVPSYYTTNIYGDYWIKDKEAHIYVFDDQPSIKLELLMDKGANPNPTNITIYHQNKELIHQELSSDSHWITFQATREDSNPYYHFIVKADSAFIPKLHDSGSTDERELSVRILDIKIRSNAR